MKRRRNGIIAKLPDAVREEVNQKLRDGAQYEAIAGHLATLGHPGVNPRNLSNWFQGGYQDWEREQKHMQAVQPIEIQSSSPRKTPRGPAAAQPVLANPPVLLIIRSMLCPDIVQKLTSRFAFGLLFLAGVLNCPAQRSTNNPSGAAELGMK